MTFASRHVSPFSSIVPPSVSGSLSLTLSLWVSFTGCLGQISFWTPQCVQDICSTGWCHSSFCSCSRRHIQAAWLTDPFSSSPVLFPRPTSDYKSHGEPPLKPHQQPWLPLVVNCGACCLPTVELFYSILDLSGCNGTRPDVQLVFTGFFLKMLSGFVCVTQVGLIKMSFLWKDLFSRGGGDTAIYGLYRYVLLWRVWFSSSLL